MLLPGPIRKLGYVLRGRVAPELGGLCVGLGWWLGLIPGFYGVHVVLILAGLILNIPLGVFIASTIIGRTCALLVAPLLYYVGKVMTIHASWFSQGLAHIPIVALTDLNRPAVIGAIAIGPFLGTLLGIAAAIGIRRFRLLWLKAEGRSELLRKWQPKWYIRLLEWLIIGPRARDAKAALSVKTRYIRWLGLIMIAVTVGLMIAIDRLAGSSLARARLERILTYLNGATVDVNALDLGLLAGRVGIAGLEFTDAERPTHNGFEVAQAQVRLDPYQLMLGRVVVSQLRLEDVGLDRPRSAPGQVLPRPPKDANEWTWSLPQVDWSSLARLERYIQDVNKVRVWLQRIRPYLPSPSPPRQIVPRHYLEYLSARQDRPQVRLIIQQVEISQIHLPETIFGPTRIVARNLTDRPSIAGLPMELALESQQGPRIQIRIDWGQYQASLQGIIDGLDLGRLQSALRQDNPLTFRSGDAAGTFRGTVSRQAIDIQANLTITGLKATAGKDGLFGLDGKTTNDLFSGLDRIEVPLWIRGPIEDPRLGFDTKAVQESLKKALVDAGKRKAIEEIQKKAEKQLEGKLPAGIGDLLGPAMQRAGLGGILRGPKDQNTP